MKTVALVPIKINSERCHLKNIKKFTNGEPLIYYILSTLLKVKELDGIYVYCSTDLILDYLPEGVTWVKRDRYFDSPSTPFNQLLASFAEIIDADTYVLAHATAPFISKNSIIRGIKAVNEEGHDSAFSVVEMQEFIWKDGCPLNYTLEDIPRTQDLDKLMIETCGLYVYRKELIIENHKRIGYSPYLMPVSRIEGCDINTEEDFWIADALYNFNKFNYKIED